MSAPKHPKTKRPFDKVAPRLLDKFALWLILLPLVCLFAFAVRTIKRGSIVTESDRKIAIGLIICSMAIVPVLGLALATARSLRESRGSKQLSSRSASTQNDNKRNA
jgi:hypothetical protein